MLNSNLIMQCMNEGVLGIKGFCPEKLGHSYYYFSIDQEAKIFHEGRYVDYTIEKGPNGLVFPGGGYLLVRSQEKFTLPGSIWGLISQASDIALGGLSLNHSATIDPFFSGYLEMGLSNLLSYAVVVPADCNFGKVVFFDNTGFAPMRSSINTLDKDKYKRRQKAGAAIEPGGFVWY